MRIFAIFLLMSSICLAQVNPSGGWGDGIVKTWISQIRNKLSSSSLEDFTKKEEELISYLNKTLSLCLNGNDLLKVSNIKDAALIIEMNNVLNLSKSKAKICMQGQEEKEISCKRRTRRLKKQIRKFFSRKGVDQYMIQTYSLNQNEAELIFKFWREFYRKL